LTPNSSFAALTSDVQHQYVTREANADVVTDASHTQSISFLHVKKGDDIQTLHEKVYRVDKWPFHRQKNVDIPSALCYRNGKSIKNRMGANAKPPGPGEDWVEVRDFKRHVLKLGSGDSSNIGSLPPGVSLARVYEDWLKFLFEAGSEPFNEVFEVPDQVWERRMCVFVAPNGWSESEKANVRKIIHQAGCVEYDHHVRFARESEATLHFCLYHGLANDLTKPVRFYLVNLSQTRDSQAILTGWARVFCLQLRLFYHRYWVL
jgi:hypothetical protein